MGKIDIPMVITVGNETCYLNIEKVGMNGEIMLTYEYCPIKQDTFLISAYGINLAMANQKMNELLKAEQLI
ncbi:MAG TPA: hypothetical protein VJ279_13535 [Hanamia sp.]|jgi:hypothetical protein|nr:hypothetical protein [Hanamia sp.]